LIVAATSSKNAFIVASSTFAWCPGSFMISQMATAGESA